MPLLGRDSQEHVLRDALWVYHDGQSPPVPQEHVLRDALWVYTRGNKSCMNY